MESEGFGAILLAPRLTEHYGGIFTSQAIGALDLTSVAVATLAACSTGSERFNGPASPDSLVRAFLDAGVSNVVAAAWDVDSEATGELFAEFYRRLQGRVHPALALQAAALGIRSRPATAHPYYWAAFQTHGNPN